MHPNPQKRSTAKPHNSQVMFGMVERGGRARIKHVKSSGVRVLIPEMPTVLLVVQNKSVLTKLPQANRF
jgi:hypothetical protein